MNCPTTVTQKPMERSIVYSTATTQSERRHLLESMNIHDQEAFTALDVVARFPAI
jgi:hypothetical protein